MMMNDRMHRAKHNGEWVYGHLIQADDYCCILEEESAVHPMDWPYLDPDIGTFDCKATTVDPETISRCSGVEDKNGKMIFEGDILAFYDENGERELYAGVVRYGEFECDIYDIIGWWIDDGFENVFIPREISEIFYVVGNICDNPEMVVKTSEED